MKQKTKQRKLMTMPRDEERRRAPAIHKKIDSIEEEDIRVAIIGTLVDRGETKVVVDDGTGSMDVSFDLSKDLGRFEEGNLVRVVGKPSNGSLDGEAIQDFEDFDVELYRGAKQKLEELRE
ncbi:MAG: hypothetical protein ACLFQ8_01840 [Candidatus Aenigmatarchaeota archaeon]